MKTIFLYTFGRMRGQILSWGLGLAVLAGWLTSFYDTLADQADQLLQMINAYPKEVMVFFGDMNQIFTPAGYLQVEFFSYMPLIVGIFAILAGSGLLAAEEESGALDLILAQPVSRRCLFGGKLLALILAITAILVLLWLGFILVIPNTRLNTISSPEMAQPLLSLGAQLLLFGCLALFLSQVLPARRIAAMVSGLVLVASFFLTSLSRLDADLEPIAELLPLHYYQGGEAITQMNWGGFLGICAAATAFALLAWWCFERRDIRVGGEGSWGLPGKRERIQPTLEKLLNKS